jgi:hypothetical protein
MQKVRTMTHATVLDVVDIAPSGPATGNPCLDVTLGATFRQGDGAVKVSGFHDGEATSRIRLMPDRAGDWAWEITGNAPALHGQKGAVTVGPALPGAHGPGVADRPDLRHADGAAHIDPGTTAYASNRQSAEMQAQTLAAPAAARFTKILMCAFPRPCRHDGTEPEHYPFALPRKDASRWPASQAGSGRASDFDRPDPAFFRALEGQIRAQAAIGVQANLILMHPHDRRGDVLPMPARSHQALILRRAA